MKKPLLLTALAIGVLTSCSTSVPEVSTDAKIESQSLSNINWTGTDTSFAGYPLYRENTAWVDTKTRIRSIAENRTYLVIAMQEEKTLCFNSTMQGCWPAGPYDGKTGFAANLGIYKMNWFMIRATLQNMDWGGDRTAVNNYYKQAKFDHDGYLEKWHDSNETVAQRINRDPAMATRILRRAMTVIYTDARPQPGVRNNFWAGHRCGETGLNGGNCKPDKGDFNTVVAGYYDRLKKVEQWIQARINAGGETNERLWTTPVRYGADLTAI